MAHHKDEPKKLFIFSTHRANRDPHMNEANHNQLRAFMLQMNIKHIEVVGRYKGVLENAFLVSAEALPEEAVLHYARHYHQDEYMVLDNHKHGTYIASMVNCATKEQRQVGFMRSMPGADVFAMNLDYTYRPDLKEYWVVWHTDTTVMTKFAEEKESWLKQVIRKVTEQPVVYC